MPDINILSLSSSDWRYPYWTSRQFLMYELARLARVFYATRRRDLREMLSISNVLKGSRSAPFAAPPGLELVSTSPRTYRFRDLDRFWRRRYLKRLQHRLDSGGIRVVYAWHPEWLETVEALSFDVLIYHPYDMFRHFVDTSDVLVQKEQELCGLANAIVTPHSGIAKALGGETYVMGNGLFVPAFPDPATMEPLESIAGMPRPVIGNLGVINDKIDFALLFDVFSGKPDWQLVFVGFEGAGKWKESPSYRSLRQLDNVHFNGGVPIDAVAKAIAGFDVGIIPYSLSGWAQFIESPLKLYQYWAMGVPVVSSPLPTLESQPGALEICHTPDEWVAGIERQLGCRNAETRSALRIKAEEKSWSKKAEHVVEIIRNIA